MLPQLTAEERELPLYFTEPSQLLSTFTQLEESNLFLIQNCQDIEQQLEELRQMHTETSAAIAVQTAQLEEQVGALNYALAQEDAKVAALRKKVKPTPGAEGAAAPAPSGAGDGSAAAALDALLPELRARIIEVYERCGLCVIPRCTMRRRRPCKRSGGRPFRLTPSPPRPCAAAPTP